MAQVIDGDNKIAYSVGHSTLTLDELVAIVRRHGVGRIIDVRRFPRSRRHPQFNSDQLAKSLPSADIDYVHVPELGGFRRPRRDSPNGAWENDSFRGYADYMRSAEFEQALERLIELATEPSAVMCAEALWTRCHRRLISDALSARGIAVAHIRSDGRAEPHALTPFAVVEDGRVSYPPRQATLDV